MREVKKGNRALTPRLDTRSLMGSEDGNSQFDPWIGNPPVVGREEGTPKLAPLDEKPSLDGIAPHHVADYSCRLLQQGSGSTFLD